MSQSVSKRKLAYKIRTVQLIGVLACLQTILAALIGQSSEFVIRMYLIIDLQSI